jgi:multidrug efflux system outer membrane protein
VRLFKGLGVMAAVGALSGCVSGIPLVGSLCIDRPQARSGIIVNALLGCAMDSVAAVPKPNMPLAFRNATAEFALDPMGAGRAVDPGVPGRSIGVGGPARPQAAAPSLPRPAPQTALSPAMSPAQPAYAAPAAQAVLPPAPQPVLPQQAQQLAAYSVPGRPATNPAQAAQAAPVIAVGPERPAEWWRLFGSAELNRLEQVALANNHDLRAAVARVQQAEAVAGVAAAPLLPSLNLNGRGQSTAPNGGVGNRVPLPDGNSQRLYQIGVVASYEIDFWGKNRATMESALASVQSSVYDRETVAMTLTADVASSYLQYLALSDRLTVAVSNVQNVTEVLSTVQKRFAIGEGSEIEVQQQATALAQSRAVVPQIALAKEQVRSRIATLIGINPDQLNLIGASLIGLSLPPPPRAVPSALLAQRPDLRKAEFDLVSSNADIAAARGRLLPSFTLSAETGYGANYLSAVFTPVGWYSILASSISGVLFDNGKSLSDIELRKAVSGERSEAYRQRVLAALQDVEDALASVRLSADVEAAQQAALERASRAYELAQMGLQLGTSDYLTILETERTRYQIEDARVQARLDRLSAAVSLFRSLGGSTEAPAG